MSQYQPYTYTPPPPVPPQHPPVGLDALSFGTPPPLQQPVAPTSPFVSATQPPASLAAPPRPYLGDGPIQQFDDRPPIPDSVFTPVEPMPVLADALLGGPAPAQFADTQLAPLGAPEAHPPVAAPAPPAYLPYSASAPPKAPKGSSFEGLPAYPSGSVSANNASLPRDNYLPEHPRGTTILALGIIGLIVFQPLAIVAWVMGGRAKKEIESGAYAPTSNVNAGRVLGIIGTILLIVVVILSIALVILFLLYGDDILSGF